MMSQFKYSKEAEILLVSEKNTIEYHAEKILEYLRFNLILRDFFEGIIIAAHTVAFGEKVRWERDMVISRARHDNATSFHISLSLSFPLCFFRI